jgi:hypothetical protein
MLHMDPVARASRIATRAQWQGKPGLELILIAKVVPPQAFRRVLRNLSGSRVTVMFQSGWPRKFSDLSSLIAEGLKSSLRHRSQGAYGMPLPDKFY